jgi:hypothetical protein
VHFEIHVEDMARARDFYAKALGWAFQRVDELDYTMVFPGGEVTPGPAQFGINGGMILRSGPGPDTKAAAPNAFVCTVAVDDIGDTLARVTAAGGRIDRPADEVPGIGRLAYVRDTESNLIGLLQPASP